MTDSTSSLVRRFLNEDPSAFGALVGRYQELVFRVCYRMLGHRQDAEDAVQETFSRVARNLGRWDPGRPIEPWLVTIAGNRCRTLLSRRRNLRSLTAEPATERAEMERSAAVLWEEIQLALDCLRPEHRSAFLLFHQSQCGYAEIAQQLACPVGTAKTWVHRARLELIRRLRERDVVTGTAMFARAIEPAPGAAEEQQEPDDDRL